MISWQTTRQFHAIPGGTILERIIAPQGAMETRMPAVTSLANTLRSYGEASCSCPPGARHRNHRSGRQDGPAQPGNCSQASSSSDGPKLGMLWVCCSEIPNGKSSLIYGVSRSFDLSEDRDCETPTTTLSKTGAMMPVRLSVKAMPCISMSQE